MNQEWNRGDQDDRVRVIDDGGSDQPYGSIDATATDETPYGATETSPPADETDLEAERLAQDIQVTRAEMSGTIEALTQRLEPTTLMDQARDKAVEAATTAVDQAKETVREATVGKVEGIMHNATHMVEDAGQTVQETGNTVIRTIRENPIPAALAGLGLWMLWQKSNTGNKSSYGRQGGYSRYQASQGYGYASQGYGYGSGNQGGIVQGVQNAAGTVGQTAGNVAGTVGETAGTVVGAVGETAGNMVNTVGQTAGSVVETVGQTAGNVAGTVGDVVGQVGDTAGRAVGQVGETASQAGDQLSMTLYRVRREASRALQENPLAVGATAVAVGAAIGLALPSTRHEQELLGNVRSTVMERAAETVEQTTDRVQETVGSR